MIQVSFSFESAREAADFLIKVGVKTEMKPNVVVSEKVETEEPAKPVKVKASKKKAEPVVDIPEEDDLLGTPPAKEFTFEDIADLAKKFLKANGSEALIKVLGQFKAKKVTDVPKSEYSKLAEALA